MRILIVGHGRCGKDTFGPMLAEAMGLRWAGTFSKYLTPFVAERLGISEEEAYETRHQRREEWRRIGDEVRNGDPLALAKLAFAAGEISGGARSLVEIEALRDYCDHIIWIVRSVPPDPTLEFDAGWADIVVDNNGSLEELQETAKELAEALS